MSVVIESITSPDTEKRLVLSNSQWAATLSVGSTWNKIRVGCRSGLGTTGGNMSGTPQFHLGFCSDPVSGFTNGPLSGANCKHFIGTISTDTLWSLVSGTPDHYTNGSGQQAGKNVLGTVTNLGGSSTTLHSADSTAARRIYMVELERQVTNWDVRVSTNSLTVDHTENDLIAAMEESDFATSCIAAGGLTARVTTHAVDEVTDGSLNAICVGWSTAQTEAHISEMMFAIYE